MVHTAVNAFGLSWIYYGRPARIPDEHVHLTGAEVDATPETGRFISMQDSMWPYPNISAWRLGDWFWNGGDTKSKVGLKTLVSDVLLASDFAVKDLAGVSWDVIDEGLAHGQVATPFTGNGWTECSVEIEVPTGVKKTKKNTKASGAYSQSTGHVTKHIWCSHMSNFYSAWPLAAPTGFYYQARFQ